MCITVLNVAYPFAPVCSDTAGGAEQIVLQLDKALVSAGYKSVVVGCEGSEVSGRLVKIPRPGGKIDDICRRRIYRRVEAAVEEAIDLYNVDLIHYHGVDFYHYLYSGKTIKLITLHLPIPWYPQDILSRHSSNTFFNCVSLHQFRNLNKFSSNMFCIPNGVDISYPEKIYTARGNYAVALGRICPEKSIHEAMDAATSAGISLFLAGSVFPYEEHEKYFAEEIGPRLLHTSHRFLGTLPFIRRRKLLSRALCCLITSRAQETSSLVAMEALACGTPVIAYPSGALCDIVEDGITGFLVDDCQQMAAAVEKVSLISKSVCFLRAAERFSQNKMLRKYLGTYSHILNSGKEISGEGWKAG
ncbi:group 1 glycosyl transferase [Chitinispirillum alkaliphilum]|nr:group 1 glycosyl transferase [Chitinispirillum alkaliphilum]